MEERKLNRSLAQISYAVTYQQATKSQRKSFPWYLKQLGLDEDWDEKFLGPFPDSDPEGDGSKISNKPQRGEPTEAEIEAFLEGGGEEWGRITMAHLQDYKAKKAAREGSDVQGP